MGMLIPVQIYNCGETEKCWKSVPEKTLASDYVICVPDIKQTEYKL